MSKKYRGKSYRLRKALKKSLKKEITIEKITYGIFQGDYWACIDSGIYGELLYKIRSSKCNEVVKSVLGCKASVEVYKILEKEHCN